MQELWGLHQICAHLGWKDPKTPIRAMKREGFLMFRRRRGSHPRLVWYTNSGLVHAWMIAKAKVERERVLAREAERRSRARPG